MITKSLNKETEVNIIDSKNSIICLISYSQEKHLLHCQWLGFINEIDPCKKAFEKLTDMVKKFHCPAIMIDSRKQTGPWPKINDWLLRSWFPSLGGAGVKYVAHIHSKHIFTQIAAQNILGKYRGSIQVRQFYTEGLAQNWLKEAGK